MNGKQWICPPALLVLCNAEGKQLQKENCIGKHSWSLVALPRVNSRPCTVTKNQLGESMKSYNFNLNIKTTFKNSCDLHIKMLPISEFQ